MQSSDFGWFKENMLSLNAEYGTAYLIIKDKKVYGAFSSYAEGVKAALDMFEPETFIVQLCGEDPSAYTNYISSFNFVSDGQRACIAK